MSQRTVELTPDKLQLLDSVKFTNHKKDGTIFKNGAEMAIDKVPMEIFRDLVDARTKKLSVIAGQFTMWLSNFEFTDKSGTKQKRTYVWRKPV